MRRSILSVAMTMVSLKARTLASSAMTDIVRVPINTDDGPAFILLGTTGDTASKSNHKTPEGIILVRQSVEGLQVDFVASESLPDDMKSGLLEKIETLGLMRGVNVPDKLSSEKDHVSDYPSISDSVAFSQDSLETIDHEVAQSFVEQDSEEFFASSNDDTGGSQVTAQDLSFTDSPPGISSRDSLSSANTTSTVSPPTHIRDPAQNRSSKLNGQGQRASSAKNSEELSSACIVTISVGVYVLIMVGVI